MAAHYDDPNFSYEKYWHSRDYEHLCEVIAIDKLLTDQTFTQAADIGGGFGRLTPILSLYSKKTYLIEPSIKQRRLASKFLISHPKIIIQSGSIQHTKLKDNFLDLVLVVRVLHHLPTLAPSITELARITKPNGVLILEFANSLNFKSRLASLITGQPILPIALERRSPINIRRKTIPFVNHHPHSVIKSLTQHGFVIEKVLSVSNFRSPILKQFLPQKILLGLESFFQNFLANLYFGPSIFIRACKLDTVKNP